MLLEVSLKQASTTAYIDWYGSRGMQIPKFIYVGYLAGDRPSENKSYWLLRPDGKRQALRVDGVSLHAQHNAQFLAGRAQWLQGRLNGTRIRLLVGDDGATAQPVKQDTAIAEEWQMILSTDSAATIE